jgi:uncharacterized membrane protein YfcA
VNYILYVSLAIFAASLSQAVTGFGFALVAAPLLTFIMGPKETVMFLLFSGLFMKAVMVYKTRHQGHSREVLVLFLGSLLGALPGSYILRIADSGTIKMVIGIILLLATAVLVADFRFRIVRHRLAQIVFGFLSGFCGATTGLNGPPVVCYYLNEELPKEAMRANLVRFFILGNTGTLLLSYYWAPFSREALSSLLYTRCLLCFSDGLRGSVCFTKSTPLFSTVSLW